MLEQSAIAELERRLLGQIAAWKTAAGVVCADLHQVSAFFHYLKTNDRFWSDLAAWSGKHHPQFDIAQLRAELSAHAGHEVRTSEELLAAFSLSPASRLLLREAFTAQAQREQSIKTAFAHESSSATATALEAMVAWQSPQSLRDRFFHYAAAETGGIIVRRVIEWIIALAIIGLLAAIAVPKLTYKGVTPEMIPLRS